MGNKFDPISGEYRQDDAIVESDPLSVHLDQTTPQTLSGGAFSGSGFLKIASGLLGVDSVTYSSGYLHPATIVVAASNSLNPAGAEYVCDGTADEVQINAALAALPATGGRVLLLDGTYNIAGQIAFGKNYSSLCGVGWSTILDANAYSTDHVINLASYTHCEIANLKIIGNDGGGNAKDLIYGTVCNDLVVQGCYLTLSDNHGVNIDSSFRVRILNNSFVTNDAVGINLDVDDSIVAGNHCITNKTKGIYIQHQTNGKNLIANNNVIGSTQSNIDCRSSDSTLVGNVSADGSSYGLYVGATACVVCGNSFRNNASDNINLQSAQSASVFSNTVRYSTNGHGIYGTAIHYSVIFGNFIYRPANTKDDIYITGSQKVAVMNNACVSAGPSYSERAINLLNTDDSLIMGNKSITWGGVHGTCGIAEDASCTGNQIAGNDMEGETTPYSLAGGTYKTWKAVTPFGSRGRFLTVTTSTGNYTVLPTDDVVVMNSTTAGTVTLPTAVVGHRVQIKNINSGVVTVDGAGSDTIDSVTASTLNQWGSIVVVCYAANAWGTL